MLLTQELTVAFLSIKPPPQPARPPPPVPQFPYTCTVISETYHLQVRRGFRGGDLQKYEKF